jgi:antitoxin protein of toxin-antitoxin system
MQFDELREQADKLVHEHKDTLGGGLDKAAELLKDKLPGHDEQIDKFDDLLKNKLEDL